MPQRPMAPAISKSSPRIFIPLSMATMVTVALLTFLWSWNDLLGPLVYINNPDLFTVQRGLAMLTGRSGTGVDRRGIIMAGSLLGMLPILIIYLLWPALLHSRFDPFGNQGVISAEHPQPCLGHEPSFST